MCFVFVSREGELPRGPRGWKVCRPRLPSAGSAERAAFPAAPRARSFPVRGPPDPDAQRGRGGGRGEGRGSAFRSPPPGASPAARARDAARGPSAPPTPRTAEIPGSQPDPKAASLLTPNSGRESPAEWNLGEGGGTRTETMAPEAPGRREPDLTLPPTTTPLPRLRSPHSGDLPGAAWSPGRKEGRGGGQGARRSLTRPRRSPGDGAGRSGRGGGLSAWGTGAGSAKTREPTEAWPEARPEGSSVRSRCSPAPGAALPRLPRARDAQGITWKPSGRSGRGRSNGQPPRPATDRGPPLETAAGRVHRSRAAAGPMAASPSSARRRQPPQPPPS